MNEKYIKKLFEENKELFNDSEQDITSPEELYAYLEDTLQSNFQWDFGFSLDMEQLFKKTLYQVNFFDTEEDMQANITDASLDEALDCAYDAYSSIFEEDMGVNEEYTPKLDKQDFFETLKENGKTHIQKEYGSVEITLEAIEV